MEPSWQILVEVLILLGAALMLGTLAEQLRQHPILGYLLAGTLVGPNVIGLVESSEHVETIAELGVALLLFTIGLEFSFRRLRRLGKIAIIGGSLQVVVTWLAATTAAVVLGLDPRGAVAVGAIITLSSTACVLQLLVDRAALESLYGRNVLGILLLQDVAVIPLMLVMAMLIGGDTMIDAGVTLLRTVIVGGGLIGIFYVLFNFAVPRLLNIRQWSRNRELPILLAIVVVLGAVVAAHRVSISPAVGAFVAGVLLGDSPFAVQIRADVSSIRTLLVTLFFASIGLLANPWWVLEHWPWVIGLVAAIVVGKTLIVWGIVRLMRLTNGMAAATGLCLAQVGEFSFLLAAMARGQVIDETIFHLVVSAMIITLFLTPFLVTAAPHLANRIEAQRKRRVKTTHWPTPTADSGNVAKETGQGVSDILVIGFGPCGQRAALALLRKYAEQITVIDLNPRNTATAKSYGLSTLVGDARQRDVLEHVQIHRVRLIIITVADPDSSRTIIHHCKHLAPKSSIIARARYHVFRWELQQAGALEVIDEEEQVGLRIAAVARKLLRNDAETPVGPDNKKSDS